MFYESQNISSSILKFPKFYPKNHVNLILILTYIRVAWMQIMLQLTDSVSIN